MIGFLLQLDELACVNPFCTVCLTKHSTYCGESRLHSKYRQCTAPTVSTIPHATVL